MMYNIFTFWTGENPMSADRAKSLEDLRRKSGCDVVLITPKNLDDYLSEPLHPAYEYLTLVHKSDYLRAYFMHHYGGGYSDVKASKGSWIGAFDELANSTADVLGYREVGAWAVAACNGGAMNLTLAENYKRLIGCCAFICRPNTDFTRDWLDGVNAALTHYEDKLEKNPGGVFDGVNYPLGWTEIMGDIFHPLILKHNDSVIQDERVIPDFSKRYR